MCMYCNIYQLTVYHSILGIIITVIHITLYRYIFPSWSLLKSCVKYYFIIFCPLPCHESYHNGRFAAFESRTCQTKSKRESTGNNLTAQNCTQTSSLESQSQISKKTVIWMFSSQTGLLQNFFIEKKIEIYLSHHLNISERKVYGLTTELPESESYLVFFPKLWIRLGLFNSSTIPSLFLVCWPMYLINA